MSWIFPLDCVVCSLGGVGLGGLGGGRGVGGAHRISHLEKADVRSFGARAVFPRCHCFRFHLREDSRLHTSPFFFFVLFFCSGSVTLGLGLVWSFEESSDLFFFFFFSPTMGDIEDPDSNRPRQSVLLSILPTKEFATSRKGSLLIAEVVRNDQRNHRWDEPNLFLCCCFRLMRTEVKARCVLLFDLIWQRWLCAALMHILHNFSRLLRLSFGL